MKVPDLSVTIVEQHVRDAEQHREDVSVQAINYQDLAARKQPAAASHALSRHRSVTHTHDGTRPRTQDMRSSRVINLQLNGGIQRAPEETAARPITRGNVRRWHSLDGSLLIRAREINDITVRWRVARYGSETERHIGTYLALCAELSP